MSRPARAAAARTPDAAAALAAFAGGLDPARLPGEVVLKAKLCLLDTLSASLSIGTTAGSAAALAVVGPTGGGGPSRIIGRPEACEAGAAAFANAVSAAASIRTDTHAASASHPGMVVIPAVLALAEEAGRDGASVLAGIVAGYEAMIRLGLAIVTPELAAIFRPTGLIGPAAAALGAARTVGLGADATARAVSLAAHTASGFNEWVAAGTNEHIYHAGFAARNAVTAIRLAQAGAEAAPTVLEGEAGLLAGFGALGRREYLTAGLGRDFLILDIVHKPVPACIYAQAPVQAAVALLEEGPLDPAGIEAIEVTTTGQAIAFPGCAHGGPFPDATSRQQSIPFAVAGVLAAGGLREESWHEPATDMQARLAARCRLVPDESAARSSRQPVRLGVALATGELRSASVPDFRSMTEAEIIARFLGVGTGVLGASRAEELLDRVLHLEAISDIAEITSLSQPA